MKNEKLEEKILNQQREIYQGKNMEKEENNGNIKMIDISELSNEELDKAFFHYSLKKDKNSIDRTRTRTENWKKFARNR